MSGSINSKNNSLNQMIGAIIPKLSFDQYKGQCGRIGVVGGCKEFVNQSQV
jgi:NAD(P)H-hydrate repair Nnr-like enzyme with NAD(P)H-hydrate dehydratase domain